jgi:hypothetical protein
MRIAIPVLVAALSSCTIVGDKKYGEYLSEQWTGKTLSEVTVLEGRPPSRVVNLPDGGIFYVWSQDTSFISSVSCNKNAQGQTNCSGGDHYSGSCEVTAQANSAGVVTSVFTSGCAHFKTGEFRYR